MAGAQSSVVLDEFVATRGMMAAKIATVMPQALGFDVTLEGTENAVHLDTFQPPLPGGYIVFVGKDTPAYLPAEEFESRYKRNVRGPVPTVGRIVLYRVGARNENVLIRQNQIAPGDLLPAMIVRVWDEGRVNLRVICDGTFDAWEPAVSQGDEPGQWNWPLRN